MRTLLKIRRNLIYALAAILMLVFVVVLAAGAFANEKNQNAEKGKILQFERINPVYSLNAYRDSEFEELGLPDTLRAVFEVSEEEKAEFKQEAPVADEYGDFSYYQYGYIAPTDETELRAESKPVIYTITYGDGSKAYRVYGSLKGEEPQFFECDEEGRITGKVGTISVKWDSSQFAEGKVGEEQRLTPAWSNDLTYDGESIYASITVSEMTKAEAEAASRHEPEEDMSVMAMATAGRAARGGTYQQAIEAITDYTSTSGNKDGGGGYSTGIPGSWKDYVNTIWMNKALPNFKFADSGVAEKWKWNGQVANRSGDPSTNPDAMPKNTGTATFYRTDVYSVQQFVYALEHVQRTSQINIKRDLDFNGEKYNWHENCVRLLKEKRLDLTINGNGHTLYNLFSYTGTDLQEGKDFTEGIRGSFLNFSMEYSKFNLRDLTFDSAFCAAFSKKGGGLFGYRNYTDKKGNKHNLTNVKVKNSLFYNGGECEQAKKDNPKYYDYGGHISAFGALGTSNNSGGEATINKSAVIDSYVYGADHVIGLLTRALYRMKAENTFVTGTLICGTGGHSAGFMSCQINGPSTAKNCFTNIDMYGSKTISGFDLTIAGTFENCFSTGKIEGYHELSAFQGSLGEGGTTVTNCYSTALVGMRSEAKVLSGFMLGSSGSNATITNCYAAGEVGNHTTAMGTDLTSTTAGGFSYTNTGRLTFTNCYYDKQTTAMREWVTSSRNTQKGQSLSGVTGVLTTDTDKGGNGLTGLPEAGKNGFQGFTGDAWHYEEGLYPQLKSIKDAAAAAWGSEEQAALARANSLVSVSTVFLDTWDTGYDWNSYGVRSKDEVPYARTPQEAFAAAGKEGAEKLDHLGSIYTYDTVREIISNFNSTDSARFDYAGRGNGYITKIENWKDNTTYASRKAFTIGGSDLPWEVNHSGMEWFNISRKSGNAAASRPIRLIAFMNVEAGEDKTLSVDETYDHRQDVELTIMNELTDDLVVGLDDDLVWATAAMQGYPGYQASPGEDGFGKLIGKGGKEEGLLQKHYYEVPTAITAFDASKDAWIYTEIWYTGKDGEKLQEPQSVKVTGKGTNGPIFSTTEEQWMGAVPIGMGMHAGMEFEISYYWMLRDGRYRTDSKIIKLTPGEYDLTEKVYNEDGSENNTALKLGTVSGSAVGVNDAASHNSELLNQLWGTDVLAAWHVASPDTSVISLGLEYSLAGNIVSSDPADRTKQPVIYNPQPGDKIKIAVPYYGYRTVEENAPGGEKYNRVVMEYDPMEVELTLEVKETEIGGEAIRYLAFDKGALYEESGWSSGLEEQGIKVEGEPFSNMQINEIEFDIEVKLVVATEYGLSLLKTDGSTGGPLAGVKFSLHEAPNGNKRTLEEVKALPKLSGPAATSADGVMNFSGMKMNKWYYLTETEALPGYADYSGMIRVYRDKAGKITMQPLNETGDAVGSAAVYSPDPNEGAGADTVKLELKARPQEEGGGVYVSTSVKNYQSVNMPETGGGGTHLLIFTGGAMLLTGMLLLISVRKKRAQI